MFFHHLKRWLEQVDPYYTQRIILRKGLFLAFWVTAINWLAKPDVFAAYAATIMLLAGIYESPSLSSYREKEQALVFSFVISGIGCVTFYLLFPFKFTLMFFALAHFAALYFFCDRYYPKFKPFMLQTIVVSALNMATLPAGNLQVAIDMFFCVMLGLFVTFLSFKFHPNLYARVWQRSFAHYLGCVVSEIGHALDKIDTHSFAEGARHLNIVRAYRRLLPRNVLLNITRSTIHIRNIQFALNHIYLKDKDDLFWSKFQQQMGEFHMAVLQKEPCLIIAENNYASEFTQDYVIEHLNKSILNWNKICALV